jgi:hypothetical protein
MEGKKMNIDPCNCEYFVEQARRILTPILNMSGTVLYSSAATLRKGDLYILGLNPGGDPEDMKNDTIEKSLNGFCDYKDNAYYEAWDKYAKGEHPLQKNVKWLVDQLGYNLREVCASNLIFARSRGASGLGYLALADICWPVHELILQCVEPKCLIVFGIGRKPPYSPYDYLIRKHRQLTGKDPSLEEGPIVHANCWRCMAFTTILLGQELKVIALPHLSRINIVDNQGLIGWIKEIMSQERLGGEKNMGEFQRVAESLAALLEEMGREGGITGDQLPEILSTALGQQGRGFNCYPGIPGDHCHDLAFFISLQSPLYAKGRGHLYFGQALEKLVQHMQGICFQKTRFAVVMTDNWDAAAFNAWRPNVNQIKNSANIEAYLLSGGNASEIKI